MGLYSKPSLALLGELINRDNPGLKTTLTPNNFMLLNGPFVTGTNQRNTRVVINGITGSGLVGKKEFYYDRINIGQLFNGITVFFDAKGGATTIADLLEPLNEQYGLSLTTSDVSNHTTALGYGYTPTPVAITIATNSVAFTGTLNVTWTRTPVGVFPESGPGSKLMLIGSLDEGYFGKVPASEMVELSRLFDKTFSDKTSYRVNTTGMFWLKYAYKGRFLFFPSMNLGVTSWTKLYRAGSVYGESGTGKFPPAGETPVAQNRVVPYELPEGRFGFMAKLPTFALEDPAPAVRSPDGEMGRLMWRVFKGTYSKGDWDNLVSGGGDTLDTSNMFVFQNLNDSGRAWATSMGAVSTTSVTLTQDSAWRPFLVLTDIDDTAFPVEEINWATYGRIKPPILSINNERDPNIPLRVVEVNGTYLRTISKPLAVVSEINPVRAVEDIRAKSSLVPIKATLTVTKSSKINLSTTNGQLNGFN